MDDPESDISLRDDGDSVTSEDEFSFDEPEEILEEGDQALPDDEAFGIGEKPLGAVD